MLCVLWIIPTFGLFISSFRTEEDVDTSGWWTVFASPFDFGQWTLENYRQVLDAGGMGTAFLNSFVVTIPSTVIPIIAASFAAYAFAWMKFPFRFGFLALLIALLVVPNYVAFIPILSLYGDLNLSGKFVAVWLAHTGFGMSLSVYLLFNYMATLPQVDRRVGAPRRRHPLADVLEADPAAVHARCWRRTRSCSSCGCGTTSSSP